MTGEYRTHGGAVRSYLSIGTMVRTVDGREGPVVYNNLDGQGVNLGRGPLTEEEVSMLLGYTPIYNGTDDDGFSEELKPNAMLREEWPGATMECLGDDWEVIKWATRHESLPGRP